MKLIPARAPKVCKYSFGRLQVIAGSAKYPGAAYLVSLAAFKAGCGYVSCQTQAPIELFSKIPEVIPGIDSEATAIVRGALQEGRTPIKALKFFHESVLLPHTFDHVNAHSNSFKL